MEEAAERGVALQAVARRVATAEAGGINAGQAVVERDAFLRGPELRVRADAVLLDLAADLRVGVAARDEEVDPGLDGEEQMPALKPRGAGAELELPGPETASLTR